MLGTTDTTGIERLNRCSPSLNDWNGWNEFLIRPIHLAGAKCLIGLNKVKRLNVLSFGSIRRGTGPAKCM